MLCWDLFAWVAGAAVFVLVRYNWELKASQWAAVAVYVAAAMVLQTIIGLANHLYLGRAKVASFAEATMLGFVVLGIAVTIGGVMSLLVENFPNAMAAFLPPLALMVMASGRWLFRGLYRNQRRRTEEDTATPVLIYGAGEAGEEVARLVDTAPHAPYRILGFIDDDRAMRFRRVRNYRVLGTGADLVDLIGHTGAEQVILAIGNAQPALIREVSDLSGAAGAKMVVVPPARERIGGVDLSQLREFDVVDLLGRRPIHTDTQEIAGYITDKVVLITGAGGSIGSELARQVHNLGPAKLYLLDRDESALHAVQLSIHGTGLLTSDDTVLCDIRDESALMRVFEHCRPDVVMHAAALKHLPMLERFPVEGWKTNVLGTMNVLRCARRVGVHQVVNVSTDKAADATSILGQSKRLGERLTAWYARKFDLKYVSVRFGNVLGSRGSVVHAFRAQIERGGPITLTHRDVTRYFMTIPEACELVLQAGAIGEPGDVMVLDMGEPVRILDVAERLIEVSDRPNIRIDVTGLRPGEKLHEVLLSDAEQGQPSAHELISRVTVPVLSPEDIHFGDVADGEVPTLLQQQASAGDARRPSESAAQVPETTGSRIGIPAPAASVD